MRIENIVPPLARSAGAAPVSGTLSPCRLTVWPLWRKERVDLGPLPAATGDAMSAASIRTVSAIAARICSRKASTVATPVRARPWVTRRPT